MFDKVIICNFSFYNGFTYLKLLWFWWHRKSWWPFKSFELVYVECCKYYDNLNFQNLPSSCPAVKFNLDQIRILILLLQKKEKKMAWNEQNNLIPFWSEFINFTLEGMGSNHFIWNGCCNHIDHTLKRYSKDRTKMNRWWIISTSHSLYNSINSQWI